MRPSLPPHLTILHPALYPITSRAGAGAEQLGLTAASSHERGEATRALKLSALPCSTPVGIESVESAEVERASRGAAAEEGLGLAATSSHRCRAAMGGPVGVPLSPPEDVAGEFRLPTLPGSGATGIEIVEPVGSEPARPAAVGDGGSVAGGEIASDEGGGTEGSRERGTPRWRTAPQRAQGPPGGGTEIPAGTEPAEELPDRVGLQRDE